jgi:hypothetical protein
MNGERPPQHVRRFFMSRFSPQQARKLVIRLRLIRIILDQPGVLSDRLRIILVGDCIPGEDIAAVFISELAGYLKRLFQMAPASRSEELSTYAYPMRA